MSQSFIIVRVEHEDGWGMFRYPDDFKPRYTIGDSEKTSSMYEIHVVRYKPYNDGIDFNQNMFCAFDSLDTFNELVILSDLRYLLSIGFKVLMLTVTEIFKGSQQVCYYKKDIIETKDISNFFL